MTGGLNGKKGDLMADVFLLWCPSLGRGCSRCISYRHSEDHNGWHRSIAARGLLAWVDRVRRLRGLRMKKDDLMAGVFFIMVFCF